MAALDAMLAAESRDQDALLERMRARQEAEKRALQPQAGALQAVLAQAYAEPSPPAEDPADAPAEAEKEGPDDANRVAVLESHCAAARRALASANENDAVGKILRTQGETKVAVGEVLSMLQDQLASPGAKQWEEGCRRAVKLLASLADTISTLLRERQLAREAMSTMARLVDARQLAEAAQRRLIMSEVAARQGGAAAPAPVPPPAPAPVPALAPAAAAEPPADNLA